jgi:hypothetical protein
MCVYLQLVVGGAKRVSSSIYGIQHKIRQKFAYLNN